MHWSIMLANPLQQELDPVEAVGAACLLNEVRSAGDVSFTLPGNPTPPAWQDYLGRA